MNSKVFHKVFSLIICLCIVLTVFSSCKKDESTTLKIPVSTIPNCYDPQISKTIDLENIINNIFEGLVRIDQNGKITKGVAESWEESSDGLTYTFHIRDTAQWYIPRGLEEMLGEDYKETFDNHVTSHDFQFAIKRALDKNTNASMADSLSVINNVQAPNDSTLIITLSRPSSTFLATLATPICMPCNEKFFNATAGRYGLEAKLILSNGPYYLKSFDKENGVVLAKNDKYFGDYKPLADFARFLPPELFISKKDNKTETTAPETTANVFSYLTEDSGGYDIANVTDLESKQLPNNFKINRYKNTINAICFNNSNGKINDNIRMALVYSTNISPLTKGNSKAEGIVPSCCGLAPGVSYRAGSNIISSPKMDTSKALSFLQNEATEDGNLPNLSLTFVMLKSDETNVKEMIQIWQKTFGVSLSITVKTYDTQAELDSIINGGSYDIAYTRISTSEFLASNFLRTFSSNGGNNIIRLNSAEYDDLIRQISNTSSEKELLNACKNAEEYLVKNGYIIPVCQSDSYLAVKDTASEVTVHPSGAVYALYK